MIEVIIGQPYLFYTMAILIGACVGSFLNVVIYRLPIILERAWKEECREMFNLDLPKDEPETFNLCVPASTCPTCQKSIPFYYNIPIVGFLILRGKCFCERKEKLARQYLGVEVLTTLLTVYVAYAMGPSVQMLFALAFTWILIALIFIDLKHYILPDQLNLGLLWLGLLANLYELFVPLPEAVLGAIIGYTSLWLFAALFYLITRKEGMGHGDFKLFAAFGAWLGWHQLPLIIIASSVVGAIVGIGLMITQGRDKSQPIPFGPFLGAAGWIALFFGEYLIHQYFQFFAIAY